MAIFQNLIAFIFVIGLLVIIHELGHFVAAKLNKIYVYQFCVGLGPKLLKYQGKETTYAICALPIGGMVDLREDENDPENARSFASKKPWQRLIVILAGAFMNFVLAYVLIVGVFLTEPLPTTTIGEVTINNPANIAGLRAGDTIVEINGEKIKYWTDITNNISFSGDDAFNITVKRDGETRDFYVGSYLGDDGYYKIGIAPELKKDPKLALKFGYVEFLDRSTMIFDGFVKIITRQIKADAVSGPVGIYKMVGEVAQTSNFANLIYFTALLSINLGIFNLLPIPFLDGGRACFIIYELIMRKPVAKEKEAFVHFLGMVGLVGLMILLIFKDLAS